VSIVYLLLINGEGVIGLIIGLLTAVWFFNRIKKDDFLFSFYRHTSINC